MTESHNTASLEGGGRIEANGGEGGEERTTARALTHEWTERARVCMSLASTCEGGLYGGCHVNAIQHMSYRSGPSPLPRLLTFAHSTPTPAMRKRCACRSAQAARQQCFMSY